MRSLFVAMPEEAIRIRETGCAAPVLVLFSAAAYSGESERREATEELIRHGAIQTLVSPEEIPVLAEAARRLETAAEVHVKIDTGMTRSGVLREKAADLVGRIRAKKELRLTGILSHFATADEADLSGAEEQLRVFRHAVDACGNGESLTVHMANSPAILDIPDAHFDMVRPRHYRLRPSTVAARPLPASPPVRRSA